MAVKINYHPDLFQLVHSDVFAFVQYIATCEVNQSLEFITVVPGESGSFDIEAVGKHIDMSFLMREYHLDVLSVTAFGLPKNLMAINIRVLPQFPF